MPKPGRTNKKRSGARLDSNQLTSRRITTRWPLPQRTYRPLTPTPKVPTFERLQPRNYCVNCFTFRGFQWGFISEYRLSKRSYFVSIVIFKMHLSEPSPA